MAGSDAVTQCEESSCYVEVMTLLGRRRCGHHVCSGVDATAERKPRTASAQALDLLRRVVTGAPRQR
jgi:hypothetical protein